MGLYGTADAVFLSDSLRSVIAETEAAGRTVIRGSIEGETVLVDQSGGMDVGVCIRSSLATDPATLDVPPRSRIIMVLDPLEQAFVVYRSDLTKADILIDERSDPDGMTAAHVVLGYLEALHDLGHDAVEEDDGRILEYRTEGGRLQIAGHIHDDEHIGIVRELRFPVAGQGYHPGTDLAGDLRGLANGRCVPGVGDQQCEIVGTDDRRGHLSDEVHIETQLDETHREELACEPGSAGTVDERLAAVDYGFDQFVAAVGIDARNGIPACC